VRPEDRYLHGAKTFVAVPPSELTRILAYYTISPGAIEFTNVPAAVTRRLGRYEVPVFRLGRLVLALSPKAVASVGSFCLPPVRGHFSSKSGGLALAIDAKDERAAAWYEWFGALRLLGDPLKLILPLTTIADALALATKG
jgi:hypothetical protein